LTNAHRDPHPARGHRRGRTDPELNAAGRARAQELLDVLGDAGVVAILVISLIGADEFDRLFVLSERRLTRRRCGA
jgi:hypothetical protein